MIIAILSSAAAILESKQCCSAALKNLLNAGHQSLMIMLPNTLNVVLFLVRLHKLVTSFYILIIVASFACSYRVYRFCVILDCYTYVDGVKHSRRISAERTFISMSEFAKNTASKKREIRFTCFVCDSEVKENTA